MNYDPSFLVEHASRLYAEANRVIALFTILGLVLGGSGGWVGDAIGKIDAGPVPVIVGLLFGGLIGFSIGRDRAFQRKLEAQKTLCQLQTEINTRPRP